MIDNSQDQHGQETEENNQVRVRNLALFVPWLGAIRPTSANDAFDPALWTTYVSTTLGLEVPVLTSLPRRNNSPLAKCC